MNISPLHPPTVFAQWMPQPKPLGKAGSQSPVIPWSVMGTDDLTPLFLHGSLTSLRGVRKVFRGCQMKMISQQQAMKFMMSIMKHAVSQLTLKQMTCPWQDLPMNNPGVFMAPTTFEPQFRPFNSQDRTWIWIMNSIKPCEWTMIAKDRNT